jgi:hypothetical protein
MHTSYRLLVAAMVTLLSASYAMAEWKPIRDYYRNVRRNNAWPEPFNFADRNAVQAPFATMIAKGWRMQNILGSYHFETDTAHLSGAGMLKIRAILLDGPPHQKAIYVERGETAAETAARIAAVRSAAMEYLPSGLEPEVYETVHPPRGRNADYIYDIEQKYRSSIPPPRLPELDTSGNAP